MILNGYENKYINAIKTSQKMLILFDSFQCQPNFFRTDIR